MCIDKEEVDKIKIIPLLKTLRLQKIDDAEYFSKKYNGYISNSRLSLINPEQENDPDAFFEGLNKHLKFSDALLLGNALHAKVLQPLCFHLPNIASRPTAKLGFVADELYKIYKNKEVTNDDILEASNKIGYYKDKMSEARIEHVKESCKHYWKERKEYEETNKLDSIPIFLDTKMRERTFLCVDAIHANKDIMNLLCPKGIIKDPECGNEQTILLDVEMRVPDYDPFIFKLKAKVDNYSLDFETNNVIVNDVKTIGKILSAFEDNFNKFHYSRELAIYNWLMSLVAIYKYNMKDFKISSNCLVVSTIPQYYTRVYKVTKNQLSEGWDEFKFLLKLAAYYYSKGYRFE